MTAIDTLPPLRQVIADHGLSARKSLGQNFLLDLNLTAKIARQAGDLSRCDVLEIGPGPGGLTRGLLSEGARRVLAIEKDTRCLNALEEIAKAYPGQLDVLNADALDVDPLQHLTPPIKIAANLPYNVGTELLIRWLTPPDWPPFWQSLTLMFQREVAERIVARPGSKTYGRLAILSQWRTEAQIVMPTVGEEMALGLKAAGVPRAERPERGAAALALFGLGGREGDSAHLLSGGEKQRLALACIHAMGPAILVMDEPTAMLDLPGRRAFRRLLRDLDQRVVIATHDLEIAADCDRLLLLDGGRVAADGAPGEVIAAYHALVDAREPRP